MNEYTNISYGFDNEGNALYAEKLHRTTNSEKYTYDALYQLADYKEGTLTSGNIPSPLSQTQYNYDGAGNRTTVNKDNATTIYATNSTNEYTTINTNALIYDANGNMLSDGTYLYQYDFENRLVAVKTPKTTLRLRSVSAVRAMMVAPTTKLKLHFKYDALGRRVTKMADKTKIDYYFDEYRVIEERENLQGNKTTTTYIYGTWIDEMLSMQKNNVTSFYHTNALGSTIAMTDNTGAVAEKYEYDAYGNPTFYTAAFVSLTSSAIGNNYLFTGREYDIESGLYYYRARHYSSALGRFMQQDPIGIWGDEVNLGNGYSYVGNNPVNRTDPKGRVFYGNWCGFGGAGTPKTFGDLCCTAHDLCWDKNNISGLSGWFNNTGNCNSNFANCWRFMWYAGIWNDPLPALMSPRTENASNPPINNIYSNITSYKDKEYYSYSRKNTDNMTLMLVSQKVSMKTERKISSCDTNKQYLLPLYKDKKEQGIGFLQY